MPKKGKSFWICKCKCGKITHSIVTRKLKRGTAGLKYIKELDAKKNKLMKKNKHIIPYFIRVKWDEEITEENIIRILTENGVPVPDLSLKRNK